MRPHGWPVLAVGLLMALGQSTLANTPLPEHPILHPPTGETHTDAYGDELPPLAQARLGTLRFRHGGTLGAVAISPDGKIVASGGKYARSVPWSGGWALEDDRWIRLWEAATGRQIRQIQVTENSIQCLNFSPDGRTLAVGWGDKVGLWEVATGHRLLFHGHPDEVQFVHFSADSATLASGDASGTVLLWDLATGKRVRSWKPERDWLPRRDKNAPEVFRSVAFSPDGQWLAWGIMRWKKWTDNSYVAEGTIYRLVRAADGQLLHQWEEPDSHG
ncbi:MAG: PD40 domain-containing protein, partial [Planctomycetes bacterium]|nr:PD40 domain-containing protein [Planctomycetota bacterium]